MPADVATSSILSLLLPTLIGAAIAAIGLGVAWVAWKKQTLERNADLQRLRDEIEKERLEKELAEARRLQAQAVEIERIRAEAARAQQVSAATVAEVAHKQEQTTTALARKLEEIAETGKETHVNTNSALAAMNLVEVQLRNKIEALETAASQEALAHAKEVQAVRDIAALTLAAAQERIAALTAQLANRQPVAAPAAPLPSADPLPAGTALPVVVVGQTVPVPVVVAGDPPAEPPR